MDIPHSQYLLLDGATSTNLLAQGMPYETCSEQYILEHPQQLIQLQESFIKAGSDILYAPTFGANRARLNAFSLGDFTYEYNKRLVALTRRVSGSRKVAGVLSPTGLSVTPYGDISFEEVLEIYKEQASALHDAHVDLFVIETMISLTEARAAVLACREYGKPIYVTFTLSEKGEIPSGATVLSCYATLQPLGISAFGFNCSNTPNSLLTDIEELSPLAKIPLIAKPNAGMPNPILPNVYDLSPVEMKKQMKALLDAGATIIGGCCGTTPEHISCMRELLNQYMPPVKEEKEERENDLLLANNRQSFSLDNDRIEFTEPISCSYDMADDILSAEEDSVDVLLIMINSMEDAVCFQKNAHLTNLPVCFCASNEDALEHALLHYQGRAMVDINSSIEPCILKKIATHYGAIIY